LISWAFSLQVGPDSELTEIEKKVLGIIGNFTSIPLFDGVERVESVSIWCIGYDPKW
jgi:hypothetical protein